jgi:anti-sigma regulatory factor (Ser/Thr protein kinase)
MGEPPQLHLRIACHLSEVRKVTHALTSFLAANGVTEPAGSEVELVLVEACTNAIKHCPPEGRNQHIDVLALRLPERVEVSVTDHTAGFDWPPRVALPEPNAERGRGLYLICSLTDAVTYERNPAGNILRFSKRVPAR